MPDKGFINVNKLAKDLLLIANKLNKNQNIALARAINIGAERSKGVIAADVAEDHGVAVGTTKRRIFVYKANQYNFNAALHMRDSRITYPSPRQLKQGASFLTAGKRRVKKTSPISMKGIGSKPFVAKLPSGGIPGGPTNKKAVVYVRPGYTNKKSYPKGPKGENPRKISALYFSSLPHLARKDWQNKVQKFALEQIKIEYPKQIKKVNKGF